MAANFFSKLFSPRKRPPSIAKWGKDRFSVDAELKQRSALEAQQKAEAKRQQRQEKGIQKKPAQSILSSFAKTQKELLNALPPLKPKAVIAGLVLLGVGVTAIMYKKTSKAVIETVAKDAPPPAKEAMEMPNHNPAPPKNIALSDAQKRDSLVTATDTDFQNNLKKLGENYQNNKKYFISQFGASETSYVDEFAADSAVKVFDSSALPGLRNAHHTVQFSANREGLIVRRVLHGGTFDTLNIASFKNKGLEPIK